MNLGFANAPDGVNYAHIGSVSQTFLTTAGQFYALSFYAAGDLYYGQTSTLRAYWGGAVAGDFITQPHVYDPDSNRDLQIVWERFSTTVVAESASTLLTFQSINDTALYLDQVQVVPIPEPPAGLLLLLGAVCLAINWRRITQVSYCPRLGN
jgi:hypothetical protein